MEACRRVSRGRAAREEPQEILNRDRLVAAVVDVESYRAFQAWRNHQRKPLAEAFAELRRICAEGHYRLEAGGRRDRRNHSPVSSPTQLVDTNVISELARARPNPGILRWAESVSRVALSVVTVEEVSFGLACGAPMPG